MDSQYPHLYTETEKIETKRMKDDALYNILMNPNTEELEKTVSFFEKKIKEKYPNVSTRMDRILQACKTDKNRLLKHSFVFFCLYQEAFAVDYFMKDNRCPPKKLSQFLSNDLKSCCEQLLKGSYTSMQAFVEDVRWLYVVV